MKSAISSLLVVVLVAANVPVAHAQSDILASATRLASTVELEQEEGSMTRGPNSTLFAIIGAAVLAVGIGVVVLGPKCGRTGEGLKGTGRGPGGHFILYEYHSVFREGNCDVAVDVSVNTSLDVFLGLPDTTYSVMDPVTGDQIDTAYKSYTAGYGPREGIDLNGYVRLGEGSIREYYRDVVDNGSRFLASKDVFDTIEPTRSDTRLRLGWAAFLGGLGVLGWGLWPVDRQSRGSRDVDFRVGVTPSGGVLATRSFQW